MKEQKSSTQRGVKIRAEAMGSDEKAGKERAPKLEVRQRGEEDTYLAAHSLMTP